MRCIFCLLFAAAFLLTPAGTAVAQPSSAQVKAAFIFKLIDFVKWPEAVQASRKINICLIGSSPLDNALLEHDGTEAGSYRVHVQKVSDADLPASNCQLAFVGNSEQRRFVALLKTLEAAPLLTLSDIDDFAEKGGGIGLRERGGRIVFEVNLVPISRAGLQIPAQLLNLAYYVFRPK